MPRKKGSTKTKTNPEDEERKQKLEVLLKQFDMEVERRIYEMYRKTEQACSHIDGMFKLALLKMPSAQKNELWEESPQAEAPAAVLSAVDAALQEAERTVQQKKPARGGRGRGRTRATPSAASAAELVTPQQPPRPLHASTPAVTPKFDPRTVQRQAPSTIRRHRPREVLMSMQGSPVMPAETADTDLHSKPADNKLPSKQLVLQTAEQLRQETELDDETKQLIARLRDQLIDMTNMSNAQI